MRTIAENIFSPAGIAAFARAVGFLDEPYAFAAPDLPPLTHLGRRGTVRCLHVAPADFDVANLHRIARQLRRRFGVDALLLVFSAPDFARVCIACFNADDLCMLTLERGRIHAADVDTLQELVPANGEGGLQLALRHVRALDRVRIGNRFFEDFRGQRRLVSQAWQGIEPRFREERDQLALLLLSRLMFLYFLQHRGLLDGNREFFLDALRAHAARPHNGSLYRAVLRPLFFGVLNRRPEKRTLRAAALGALPYLNGGLFERHPLERRFPDLDLADPVLHGVFGHLLERYRFTATEGEADLAVDPEMLGRVFEGLMAESARQTTGTFYTPAPVVRRMVRSAFDAYLGHYPMHHGGHLLREVRVLDPACGSGAFLLAALAHITERRVLIEQGADAGAVRAHVVAHNLHGVDLQQDAALLCALRLWLALIPSGRDEVQPLPNLDRRIRQGDALVDPLDLATDAAASPEVRAARRTLQPLVQRYTTCDPEERAGVHRLVARHERSLSRAWLDVLVARARRQARELAAQAAARDLFGAVPSSAHEARGQLVQLQARVAELRKLHRKLRESGTLPFFSFNVHFADARRSGFDIILCNPPWVRSHNWPPHLARTVRGRFRVCRDAGQVDLAMLFLERAISLLAPGGVLAIILPAKFLRSASAGAARALMLERMEIISIEDHSLDHRSIFGASAFAAIILARRKLSDPAPAVPVTLVRRQGTPLGFPVPSLAYDRRDPQSPWLLAPAAVRTAMHAMLDGGRTVAAQLAIRRGVVTGANGALIVTRARARIGDLAEIETEDGREALIEDGVLRPLVRGCDVGAWHIEPQQQIIFCHDDASAAYRDPPRRVARFLREHQVMDSRGRLGALQHVASANGSTRVAWHDLADTLKAAVLPPCAPCMGALRPIIPLNTVYYIALDRDVAPLLAAYFNSLPVRVFARAIAERAKDAHFRFFARTVGQLPLPVNWQTFPGAARLRELAAAAHAAGSLTSEGQQELDELVAAAYGLTSASLLALHRFDEWLRGEPA